MILFAEWAGCQPGKKSKGWCADPHCDTAVLSVGPIGPFMTWQPRPCTYSGEVFFIPLPVSVLPAALFCLRALHDALLIWHHAWGSPSAGICNVFMLEFLTPHPAGHRTTQLMCLFCRKIGYRCLKLRNCRNIFLLHHSWHVYFNISFHLHSKRETN